MIKIDNKSECCGCTACVQACPIDAIHMYEDDEGFLYPEVSLERCIKCNNCVTVCPILNQQSSVSQTIAYGAYNKNLDLRMQSTSGAIFSTFAIYVIEKLNGVIFGAIFDDKFRVIHSYTDSVYELRKFRGSKYPQSIIKSTYLQVKEFLLNNRYVLFVGTPCQVEGLLKFLGKKYDNLFCMDFVCHGVASPMVWREYLNNFQNPSQIETIVFKDKREGWKEWHFKIKYHSHEIWQRGFENPFMYRFLQGMFLRPSCYNCKFKGLNRMSDFTIADCWGIGETNTSLNDNKGLSALLIHSDNGRLVFENVKGELKYQEYDPLELMSGNYTTFKSVPYNPKNDKFYKALKIMSFEKAFRKYCFRNSLSQTPLGKIYSWYKSRRAGNG